MSKLKSILSIIIVFLFSCTNKEDKLVQAEFDKLEGQWTITNFKIGGSVTPNVKAYIKTGGILFRKCIYNRKAFDKNTACGADFDVNGELYGMGYKYDLSTDIYDMSVGTYASQTSQLQQAIAATLAGTYKIVIVGNTMTAVQKSNVNYSGLEVSFTATRK